MRIILIWGAFHVKHSLKKMWSLGLDNARAARGRQCESDG